MKRNGKLPYITLHTTAHAVVGVAEGGRTFSEPTEDPKAWAAGFLVAYRFAGGDGEILNKTPTSALPFLSGDFPVEGKRTGLDNEEGTRS